MDPLSDSLLWCIVQVTLVALLAWLLCTAVSRWTASATALVPSVALAAIVVLTASAFIPWPSWWRYGPRWEASIPTVATARHHTSSTVAGSAAPAEGAFSLPTELREFPTEEPAIEWPSGDLGQPLSDEASPAIGERFWFWLPVLLAGILGFGVVLGLLQLAGGLLSVRAYRRASQALDDAELLELMDCLRAELSLTRSVALRQSDNLATAATIGWTRPVILLPPTWREWTQDQRRAVLAHELAHVARGDYSACVLAQLCVALHFYHPMIHWLAARLRLEQELAADATAALLVGGRKLYLQSLAELALHTTERPLGWPAHTFLPTQGTFLRRIEMLRDSKHAFSSTSRRGIVHRWAAVGLLVVGAAVIAGLRGGSAPSPSGATANAQPPLPATDREQAAAGIDLAYVSNDAKMLLAIRPAEVSKVPEIREVLTGAVREGASPFTLFTMDGIQQVTLFGFAGIERDDPTIVLQFNKATSFEAVAKTGAWPADAERVPGGAGALQQGAPRRPQAYGVLNDRTIVLGSTAAVGKCLANRRKGQPAIAAGAAWEKVRSGAIVAALDMEVIRDQFRSHPADTAGEAFAKGLAPLAPLWADSEYVVGGILVEGKAVQLRAIATCHDAELAEHVAETVGAATTLARNMLRSAREGGRDIPDFAQFAMTTADGLLKSVKVERTEALVVAQTRTDLPTAGSAVAGNLIQAIAQSRVAAQRATSMNVLRQIMLGMHNWADANGGRLPPPVIMGKDGKGKVPHSWRIELLPYIGQEALYRQYHFDESWDSEANKRVLEQMPALFRHPLDDSKCTNAAYYVLTAPKLLEETPAPGHGASPPEGGFPTAFSAKNGMSFGHITDGMSNTLAVVEAKRDIPWTKPEDILFDPAKDPPKLGGYFKEGFNAGLCDGAVRFLSQEIDPKTLKLMIMPGDGMPLPRD
jgi:beta-lactamase regulating signal transducer with metallopeptidase domain